MERVIHSKYDLIKAVLESNLEEDVKEDIVNSLINYYQPQPVYYRDFTTTTTDCALRNGPFYNTGD